jgi:hypothetical protein
MKALSIRQPWIWAIIAEGKWPENRSRPTSYRGPLALHASRGYDTDATLPVLEADEQLMKAQDEGTDVRLTTGAILAVAELSGCHPADECEREWGFCTPWAEPGLWHWEIGSVRPLARPVPAKGMLGLWKVPEDAERAVRAQLEASHV